MYTLKQSTRKNKKFMVILPDKSTVHFGDTRYKDYTKHLHHVKDSRKKAYLNRHKNEDWTLSGINTAGFWSRWLLWNKNTIEASIKDIERKFKINISYK